MTKDDAACQELHAGDGGDDDGLKDMDVAMDSPFPTTFGEEDVKQEVEALAAVMTSPNVGVGHDKEIYNLLDDVNDVSDAAMFYDFPRLHDFPCLSSSSSSSSAPIPSKPVASTSSSSSASSSSATSWGVFRSETEDYYNSSEEIRHHSHNDHIQRQQRYGHQTAVAAALSSTASMEINLPLPDDSNPNQGDAHCINVIENFEYMEYMDLLDGSDIWDPCSILESENPYQQQDEDVFFPEGQQQAPQAVQLDQNQLQQSQLQQEEGNDGLYFLQGNSELALIFFDWLKQNKDWISAQEMRSIKLKRATIDCALKRLGATREGKKKLLKLILEWVAQYQLQKKGARAIGAAATDSPYDPNHPPPPPPDLTVNTSSDADLNCNPVPPDPNTCFSPPSTWAQPATPAPCVPESSAMMAAAYPHTMGVPGGRYMCDIPYSGAPDPSVNGNLYVPTSTDQYQTPPVDSTQTWNIAPAPFVVGPYCHYRPFPDATTTNIAISHSHAQAVYGSPYPYPIFDSNTGERVVSLGSSATKEARKKRMARQRKISTNQYRHLQHHNHHQNLPQDLLLTEQEVHVAAAPGVAEDCNPSQANPTANWIYWPPPPPAKNSIALVSTAFESSGHAQNQTPVGETMQQKNQQQRSQPPAVRKQFLQGLKTEKNLKFLLQKVLKQSDVGNLGRIVLPKKEAEIHLPELESRDGISIAMEDIGTSNIWNMRYRFWPNNKSRMYLLENTGEFVRLNGLQEGDFIVIYSDTKCGKYLIRGVKVRQPGSKPEAKKRSKKNQRNASQPSSKQTKK